MGGGGGGEFTTNCFVGFFFYDRRCRFSYNKITYKALLCS